MATRPAARPAPVTTLDQAYIVGVAFGSRERAVAVGMSNGRLYTLPVLAEMGADRSAFVRCTVSRGGEYFSIRQASGNRFYVPGDLVLYHCEPAYRHYKGRPEQQRLERESTARVAARVRELRRQRGLTVTALAGAAGMARPNVSRIERGEHSPSLDTLDRIAKALGVTIADLVAAGR